MSKSKVNMPKRIEKEMQYNHSFSDWCIGSGRTYTDTNV